MEQFFVLLKRSCITGFSGFILIFLLLSPAVYCQQHVIRGCVKDEITRQPVPNVNVRLYGTSTGSSTDKSGKFSVTVHKTPATIVFSCIGYEDSYYDIMSLSPATIEFFLRPKTYSLEGVEISDRKYSYLFKKKDYSVLDYELTGDQVLLMIFRSQLKKAELVLLNRLGDTLGIGYLPEQPPSCLYKDFLQNVHYISKNGAAYQCYFEKESGKMHFLYKTTMDSLMDHTEPFLFKMGERIYFLERQPNGFGAAIGYYSKEAGKQYISKCFNERKMKEYFDDQRFYSRWNDFSSGGGYDEYEARAHQLFFWSTIFPVVRTKDSQIAVFDFANDIINILDGDGELVRTIPITFHKDQGTPTAENPSPSLSVNGWHWGNQLYTDSYNLDVYTVFLKNGMTRLHEINMQTGELETGTVLPFPFPRKIEIYKGEACFLCKDTGDEQKWKLVKCMLNP